MRRFPILFDHRPSVYAEQATLGLEYVAWEIVAPHEAQAQLNHHQSLERLAERGGLSPDELLAVLENRPWRAMSPTTAALELRALLKARGVDL